MAIILKDKYLTLEDFIKVARFKEEVVLSEDLKQKINEANKRIRSIVLQSKKVYGVNTGFGKLSEVVIENKDLHKLQENLLKSHACGVGENFDEEVVRGMMVLRVNALARGYSGIRLEVVNKLIELLNKNVIPIVPSQGSLGASGDLAPLAHMSLPILGLGEVMYEGIIMPSKAALEKANIEPIKNLEAKEGLSLINGTQAMTSVGALTLYDSIRLSKIADIALSLSLEALRGIKCAFDERVHKIRGQVGQIKVAENVRKIIQDSTFITTQGQLRTQDAYSLRCASQVHGASRDAISYLIEKVELEMNAATDNPLVFNEEDVISGGNFHGEIMAQGFDFLKLAIAEFANISERRLERLVNPALSEGLPAFLVAHPGINSGFMIVQYSAASLVSENKVLAHPASVDSIPSSGNQEDHVSMGTISARGARDILNNSLKVLAMEILASLQAIDFRKNLVLGKGTSVAYKYLREKLKFIEDDAVMYPYINECIDIIKNGNLIEIVEKEVGKL
ncbi:MAG: histidine ammonia-lyase [Bacilli bacterium]|nr:histidine ammonia-lyase [Bacilli bacterium]